ncbi:MAG: response regulator [Candidatus Symbiothrix sp.]|jgi:signal transduction histidine kinase/DNA-binding response OmpR family regulator/ligand-binding sensor domain-containing protein|nr:response regulator [Candidatus Symbiothrix sp.]
MKTRFWILLLLGTFAVISSQAYNLRQISSRDGLSNSSAYCLFQDSKRFLWIGTFDGLNMYDGREIHIYKPDINNENSLSSNVIRKIMAIDDNYLWISTKWGLNKLSRTTNHIEEYYNEYKEDSQLTMDERGNLFVLSKKGVLSLYDASLHRFWETAIEPTVESKADSSGFFCAGDTLYILSHGKLQRYTIDFQMGKAPKITRQSDYTHSETIDYAYYDAGKILFIDRKGLFYSMAFGHTTFLNNLSSILRENGAISSLISDQNDFLIGFKTNGLIRLNAKQNYAPELIDINCGVFCLWKDPIQNIIWIGTDGQGIFAWIKDTYTFKNLQLSQLSVRKQRPIRAIYTDAQNLWMATKGNGIIRVKNFHEVMEYSSCNTDIFTTDNGLSNNEVFAIEAGKSFPVLWIGSDGPDLNYFSYQDHQLHKLANHTENLATYVHSLFEAGDSTLWIGTGNSLLHAHLQKRGTQLEIDRSSRFTFDLPNPQPYNQIFDLYPENDSILWIGMRGNGLIRFNMQTADFRLITFDKKSIAPLNDILCIHQDKNKTFWLGTSYGLIRFVMYPDGTYDYKNYNENVGLPNNTIHGILEDAGGKLWLSSNTGLILFNPEKETFRSFNQKTGLKTIEFSDNSYFKDTRNAMFFFGGVDGLVSIKQENDSAQRFVPSIYFTSLRIFNRDFNIRDFEKTKKDVPYLQFKHYQNSFAVRFVAIDFINGENSRYSYQLANFSNVWMDTPNNEAQFTNIPPGNYVLNVKYNDGITDNENTLQSIRIVILPPWYLSVWAKIFYFLLICASIYGVYYYVHERYERKKRKIAHQYKEAMQEEKLRFFTNITHEFCTPLTLIYSPCERLLNYEESDSYIKKYVRIIQSNTERLNSLVQEIIDYRRIETGHQVLHVEPAEISGLLQEISDSFNDLAEQNQIRFQTDWAPDLHWNTDPNCFRKIFTNLISNAFKYTSEQGEIKVSAVIENERLQIAVHNTGQGIRKEDIPLIFNRYSVMDNIKENAVKGLSSRNGLGLAICHSAAQLLQGDIRVESEVGQYARFIVSLPDLEISANTTDIRSLHLPEKTVFPIKQETAPKNKSNKLLPAKKAQILAIDDNQDILWILSEILSDEYTVVTAQNAEEGLQQLKQATPDLIITDIMMPNLDGFAFTRQLKQNRHTMHIPLVILSAKNSTEEKIEGIESGADVYVHKPFYANYLKAVIKHLLNNRKKMEEYYNTSAGAFDYSHGKLIQKEDKELLQQAVEVIRNNIDNNDFMPDELAAELQLSVRNLYRKFKSLGQPAPKDFIKEQRINYAAKLLITTTLTIQEIMYKTGFTNRSHFYKEFAKRFDQLTPKEYRENNKLKDDSLE